MIVAGLSDLLEEYARGGGGGGSLPLEARTIMVEKTNRAKWVYKSGVGADREKDVKIAKNRGGGGRVPKSL